MRTSFNPVSILCYDNEDTNGTPPATPPATPPKNPPGGNGNERMFTQEDVNKFMAEEKRKEREKYSALETSYQELLQSNNLTKEQRDNLQSRLEDVQKSQRTKEQQAEFERKQSEEKYKTELESEKARANHWENLFKRETVVRSLQDAAGTADAFNPNQIVGLLKPMTELKDIEGTLTPMVDFPDIDEKTGEEIKTLCSPADAVKRMRQLPKIWGNLFKSNVVSGVGAGQGTIHDPSDIDYSTMDAETYRKNRAAIKARVSGR
jgi:actin-related protein